MSSLPSNNYSERLSDLKSKIRQARVKAAIAVNNELLGIFWEIGVVIAELEKEKGWGAKVVEQLSKDLRKEFPDMKGFSPRNLRYMRDFSLAYPLFVVPNPAILQNESAKLPPIDIQDIAILQSAIAKLSWSHHQSLLDKVKDQAQRLFYIDQTVKNGWSRDVMILQIESELHKRNGSAITNFQNTLPALQSDLAQQTLKSPYILDFIAADEKCTKYNWNVRLFNA